MNTKKHAEIAEVGEKIIKEALKRAGRGEMRIAAFEMGNWLTDVSQCVDPVGYRMLHGFVKMVLDLVKPDKTANQVINGLEKSLDALNDGVTSLFHRFLHDAPGWIPENLGKVKVSLEQLQKDITINYADFLRLLDLFFKSRGRLREAVTAAFGFLGFYKFVLPNPKNAEEEDWTKCRMDIDSYLYVFTHRFTQYLPHEHLDRPLIPEKLQKDSSKYSMDKADGPLHNPTEKENLEKQQRLETDPLGKDRPGGDLYKYLREDIKLAAALFAELDGGPAGLSPGEHSWAEATFNGSLTEFTTVNERDQRKENHKVDDTDPEWNLHLALLGHALHAAEDYFGHSTFVDQASRAFPGGYDRFQRLEDKYIEPIPIIWMPGPFRIQAPNEGPMILARRLKEWNQSYETNNGDWKQLANDSHVVTGYFDFWDTLVSISHVANELFGSPATTVGHDADKAVETVKEKTKEAFEYDYLKLFRDTVALCADKEEVWDRNNPKHKNYDKNDQNEAVRLIRKAGGKNLQMAEGQYPVVNDVIDFMLNGPLKDHPPEVKKYFKDSVVAFTQIIGIVGIEYNLYKLLMKIAEFAADPAAWLTKQINDKVLGYVKDKCKAYLKNALWAYLGARRIGCHSLINKDAGAELFFNAAMECAKATHWYVLHRLVRHSRKNPKQFARGPKKGHANFVYKKEYVDWVELLEHFLDHPFAKDAFQLLPGAYSGPRIYVTRTDPGSIMSPDSLQTLTNEARLSFFASANDPEAPRTADQYTWMTIADINFPGVKDAKGEQAKARQVNKVLRERGEGHPVPDKVNYAFKPGLRLTIPYQRIELPTVHVGSIERKWWYPVILDSKKHMSVAAWFSESTGSLMGKAPTYAHRLVMTSKAEHEKLIKEAAKARAQLMNAYNDQADGWFESRGQIQIGKRPK